MSAVLAAAGRDTVVARRELPARLTDREVEVLGLVSQGDAVDEVVAAVSILGPEGRLPEPRLLELAPTLSKAARRISERLAATPR